MMEDGLLLFDGDCSFCNQGVQFILKHDLNAHFTFATLNGDYGKKIKEKYHIPTDLDSIILIEHGKYYSKSTAVLRICKQLNSFYPILSLLGIIPRPIRNIIYNWVARNRLLFSKKTTACMLPTPEEKKRFINTTE